MSRNRLRAPDIVEMTQPRVEDDFVRSLHHLVFSAQELVREAELEVVAGLDQVDFFLRKLDAESFDVALQVSYFSSSYDWEGVGC